ncbi:MAG: hypothetical protein NWF01_02400 [Candidatus Bathyarchaeota archaeon]|nr:hypothetical protein [Candidatus Bathyarchaeota archaeon]
MKRSDAVTMLRELNSVCRSLNEVAITLIADSEDETSSYQLRIKANLDTSDKQVLKEILQKSNLSFKEEEGTLTIYKAKNLT